MKYAYYLFCVCVVSQSRSQSLRRKENSAIMEFLLPENVVIRS